MGKLNRYKLTKKCYKDYVIILLIKNKLYTYINNKLVSFKDINKLKKLHINYVILDNLDVIVKKYEDNNYKLYYLKYILNSTLDNILYKWKRGNYYE